MNRLWILLLIIAVFPALILAQTGSYQHPGSKGTPPPYQPAVPSASMINAYGAYPGYVGGTTAAGSAMNGMSNVISAKGNYNLSTSAAAVNMTQAQKNEIQNHQLYTNTYFEMQATNKAARQAAEGPPPTMEQIARMAREGMPKPVTANEVDPVTGRIYWPVLLQQDMFASHRAELEKIMEKKSRYGSLDFSDQMQARQIIETMFEGLKSQISQVPTQDYLASKEFLRSLIYATCKGNIS
jgi:hypothetical protein